MALRKWVQRRCECHVGLAQEMTCNKRLRDDVLSRVLCRSHLYLEREFFLSLRRSSRREQEDPSKRPEVRGQIADNIGHSKPILPPCNSNALSS